MIPLLLEAGDGAFTIQFGDGIDAAVNACVNALARMVDDARRAGRFACIRDLVPTFRSLLVVIDPLAEDAAGIREAVMALAERARETDGVGGRSRRWVVPVCYDPELGPDLEGCATQLGLTPQALAAAHAEAEYGVYMLGFMPGFAYMGGLPSRLHLPRRATPRTLVPAGSVAVAESLCAIYPWDSPGGWHLLGRTPVPLFSLDADRPSLLAPGDRVRFRPMTRREFDAARADPLLARAEEAAGG